SRGGLCDGVMTMPSVPGFVKIACETAGVGVKRPLLSTRTSTSLAIRTSSADTIAGSDKAWVSRPTKIAPSTPCCARQSTIGWVIAHMWVSLDAEYKDVVRCPVLLKVNAVTG